MAIERLLPSLAIYLGAAFFEIVGSYALWSVFRLGKSPVWLVAGAISLFVFAWLLTMVDLDASGRAYAAYGGIYILSALAWLWLADGQRPDAFDIVGVALCVLGAVVILLGRHASA